MDRTPCTHWIGEAEWAPETQLGACFPNEGPPHAAYFQPPYYLIITSFLPSIDMLYIRLYHRRLRHILPGKRKRFFKASILWPHASHAVTFQHFVNLVFNGNVS